MNYPPWQSYTRLARATQLAFEIPRAPAGYQTYAPAPNFVIYRATLLGQTSVRQLLAVLLPQLFERHWTDHQCCFVLDWSRLLRQIRQYLPDWGAPLEEIPAAVRNRLVQELLVRGYQVELPLPPQTCINAILSWRADLYFKNQ